jgi:transcription initiation factor TFIID TATA-box-binding protein
MDGYHSKNLKVEIGDLVISRSRIVSMVTIAHLGQKLDLREIASHDFISYDPSRFPAAYYKFAQPRITFAVFANGKVVSWGGSSLNIVQHNFRLLVSKLQELSLHKDRIIVPRVRMLVAEVDLGEPINIEVLASFLSDCIYEPEQFPGVIWRLPNHVVVLIFSSGKCMITGVASEKSLEELYKLLHKLRFKTLSKV